MSEAAREMLAYVERSERRRLVRVADLRPSYANTLPGLTDRLARKDGHWMGGLTYALRLAELGAPIRKVPAPFWMLTVTDDGFPCAEVACPCGHPPIVEALAPLVRCECERRFFFDGDNVWAFNTPAAEPEPAEETPDDAVD